MCGVVGALVFDSGRFRVSEDYVVRMRDTMVHRGRTEPVLWIADDRPRRARASSPVDHRPLRALPRSRCATKTSRSGSSFNGEIYNHAEIRRELESIGEHRWKTDHSDTEVILHAFEQWGIDCLERFRGMFAFALWDARDRELWLVRDRIGIKPLYYSIHHGRITFASEIKALLEDPEQASDGRRGSASTTTCRF